MPLITQAGRHRAQVKTAQLGESDKGTPFLQISFETATGESLNGWLYLSEAAFERSLKVLRETFNFDDNFDTIIGQVEGKWASIVCELEEDDKGKERMRVKWINPDGAGAPAKPIADQGNALKTFSAKAARIARPVASSGVTRHPPAPRPPQAQKPVTTKAEPF